MVPTSPADACQPSAAGCQQLRVNHVCGLELQHVPVEGLRSAGEQDERNGSITLWAGCPASRRPLPAQNNWAPCLDESHVSLACFSGTGTGEELLEKKILPKAAAATFLGWCFHPKQQLALLPGSIACLI
ncbi:hypothetical protein Anapl_03656 [Anas platyrhynchos]|uniref:Uncharacterized protein n=1 Tax=Anas platyrhynchos TaxID=8839 RepID=R0M2L1_ANAPL|nr:hypothetical protein Anapl_03656 [Anas platyrhynchos]